MKKQMQVWGRFVYRMVQSEFDYIVSYQRSCVYACVILQCYIK